MSDMRKVEARLDGATVQFLRWDTDPPELRRLYAVIDQAVRGAGGTVVELVEQERPL